MTHMIILCGTMSTDGSDTPSKTF